ncbi:MAG: PDZ domain-containing protein [Lentisphaeria bacterium]|nr:PDZ domain-containing protein [Lentisphaeria bacterium]
MNSTLTRITIVLLLCTSLTAVRAGNNAIKASVLRVKVTAQAYDTMRPWQKRPPSKRETFGVVVGPGQILTSAVLVANATLVGVERIDDYSEATAQVECVDYVSNLALITIADDEFNKRLKPVKVAKKVAEGKSVKAYQFEANGTVQVTEGRIKTVETGTYAMGLGAFLVYRVSAELRLGNTGLVPFFRRGSLAGLMVGYRDESRTASLIPGPVIRHFLDDWREDELYDGFPRVGFGYAPIKAPQIRRYVGLEEGEGGIYVTYIRPGSPADRGGLKKGDVLLGIAGFPIDRHAQYDDPDYGNIGIAHLISTRFKCEDKVLFEILRDGNRETLEVRLFARSPHDWPIEPIMFDRQPKYLVSAGVIYRELSRDLLRAWGKDWQTKAPRRLTRYERKQWKLLKPGEKVVVVFGILPSPLTIGYEGIRFTIVKTINGQPVTSLKNVAAAMKKPLDGFNVIAFENPSAPEIVLKSDQMQQVDDFIRKRYRLQQLSHL